MFQSTQMVTLTQVRHHQVVQKPNQELRFPIRFRVIYLQDTPFCEVEAKPEATKTVARLVGEFHSLEECLTLILATSLMLSIEKVMRLVVTLLS
jgi:hypothetical protein